MSRSIARELLYQKNPNRMDFFEKVYGNHNKTFDKILHNWPTIQEDTMNTQKIYSEEHPSVLTDIFGNDIFVPRKKIYLCVNFYISMMTDLNIDPNY